jgi:hypothetical protein
LIWSHHGAHEVIDHEQRLLLLCIQNFDKAMPVPSGLAVMDWDRLIALAENHGVVPLVHTALGQVPAGHVPTSISARLWAYFAVNGRINHARTQELIRILNVLKNAGIRAVPFKGPVLTASLYGDLQLRVFADLDLLIGRSDVLSARDLLANDGYHSLSPVKAEDEAAFLAAQRQYDFELVHETTRELVELHWKTNHEFVIERLDDTDWWSALETVDIDGTRMLNLNPRETMFALLIHGSKHLWSRLSWLVDIALLARKFDAADWSWLVDQANAHSCKRRLGLGLLLAKDLLNVSLPQTVTTSLCGEAIVERIAKRISQQAFAVAMPQSGVINAVKLDAQLYDTHWQRVRRVALLAFTPNAQAWTDHGVDRNAGGLPLWRRWKRLFEKYARY